jgi:hypothetical protein
MTDVTFNILFVDFIKIFLKMSRQRPNVVAAGNNHTSSATNRPSSKNGSHQQQYEAIKQEAMKRWRLANFYIVGFLTLTNSLHKNHNLFL